MKLFYKARYRKDAMRPSAAFPLRKTILRPKIQITLINGKEEFPMLALIDSGADNCLFDAAVATSMGIAYKSGAQELTRGIGNQTQTVYFHELEIELNHKRWKSKIGFIENLTVGGLLGREGFFDKFVITFDQSKGEIIFNE